MAGSGFCTIAPGYSRGGDAWHAGDILDVDLDQTESMLIWMRESGITSGQVGLYGTSRGAEHALLVTSLMARHARGIIYITTQPPIFTLNTSMITRHTLHVSSSFTI